MKSNVKSVLCLFLSVLLAIPTSAQNRNYNLKESLLTWKQFEQLNPQERGVYMTYVAYATALLEFHKSPTDVIEIDPSLQAQYEFHPLFQLMLEPTEAQAIELTKENVVTAVEIASFGLILVPGVGWIAAGGMRASYAAYKAYRSRGFVASVKDFFKRGGKKSEKPDKPLEGEIFSQGKEIPAKGPLKDITPGTAQSNLPALRPGSEVGRVRPAAPAAPAGPTRLKSTDVPPAAVESGWKPLVGSAVAGAGVTQAVNCAAETGLCSKPQDASTTVAAASPTPVNATATPSESPTPGPSPSPSPNAEAATIADAPKVPEYSRLAGDTCIFAGYGNKYSSNGDGGCKPPAGILNSKSCKSQKKPNFKCNDFGLSTATNGLANLMCVPVKKGQNLDDLTAKCLDKMKELLKRPGLKISKEEYEAALKNLKDLIDSKSTGGKLSIGDYCSDKNKANQGRQAKECEALEEMLKQLQAAVPVLPPTTGNSGNNPAEIKGTK